MSPELAAKLIKLPEGKDLVKFLVSEALRLNNLDDIKLDNAFPIALEVKARQRAYETVTRMLDPLISVQNNVIIPKTDEYAM